MRNWSSYYGYLHTPSFKFRNVVEAAQLPGDSQAGTRVLGDFDISVSKYSDHVDDAVAAIRYLTGIEAQRSRAAQVGSVPTRSILQQDTVVMKNTPFRGPLAGQAMAGVFARPSVLAGQSYDRVSRAYFEAVHSALTRHSTSADALARAQKDLAHITGFRPVPAP
jgi:trehalose/maltose transport system substrate-binding protein